MSLITLSGNASGSGTLTIASQNTNSSFTLTLPNETGTFVSTASSAVVTPAMINGGQTGSAPGYVARSWVNFNGTSTVAIRASGNVTSITDNGTGDYTVNFTTAMPDADYAATSIGPNIANSGGAYSIATNDAAAPTSSAYRLNVQTAGGVMTDRAYLFVAFFR